MTYLQRQQDKKLQILAKNMRRNMTKEERHLWFDFFQDYPVRIVRQKIILGYIVDFYCAKAKLGIEVDGGQHYEELNIIEDDKRTKRLEAAGIEIFRVTNLEVQNEFLSVTEIIDNKIEARLKSLP